MEFRKLKPVIAACLLTALHAQAIDFIQTNQFLVAKTNSLTRETWVSAQRIDLRGAVSNDLFATAPDTVLNGTFMGDAWVIGDSITASGDFRSSTRILSRTAQVQGTHYGSVIAAGTTVKIDRTAVLHSDLLCLGENVIVEGSVHGET